MSEEKVEYVLQCFENKDWFNCSDWYDDKSFIVNLKEDKVRIYANIYRIIKRTTIDEVVE